MAKILLNMLLLGCLLIAALSANAAEPGRRTVSNEAFLDNAAVSASPAMAKESDTDFFVGMEERADIADAAGVAESEETYADVEAGAAPYEYLEQLSLNEVKQASSSSTASTTATTKATTTTTKKSPANPLLSKKWVPYGIFSLISLTALFF